MLCYGRADVADEVPALILRMGRLEGDTRTGRHWAVIGLMLGSLASGLAAGVLQTGSSLVHVDPEG